MLPLPSSRRPRSAARRSVSIAAGALIFAGAAAGAPIRTAAQTTPAPAPAPTTPRRVADQGTVWFIYTGDHAVSNRWALNAELQVRRADGVRQWQQLLVRPGLIYTLTPAIRLAAGYAFAETWPYGEQPALARFGEHRLWEQVQLTHATGRVQWQHRYRFEQRWVHAPLADASFDRVYTNRVRYLARATVPLGARTVAVGKPYVTASDEVLLNWGRNVQRNTFDQNRLYAAVGFRPAASTRVEVGYLQQLLAKADGVRLERNHTLQVAVLQSSPLRRRAR